MFGIGKTKDADKCTPLKVEGGEHEGGGREV